MMTIRGYWYNGKTSARREARCRIDDGGVIRIEGIEDGRLLTMASAFAVKVSARLADTSRYLHFATGETFETKENDAIDVALKRFGGRSLLHLVHKLESRKGYVLLCLAGVVLFAWAFATHGVPLTARLIAERLPPTVYRHAGKQTLEILDRSVFGPTQLDDSEKMRLVTLFEPVLSDHHEHDLRILFRKGGPIGPNAFALPDGTIVFTDEMVRVAEHVNELVSVLAHEIGHVLYRHGMRMAIQDSRLAFALLAMTGDVSGTSELFMGLPVMLTQLSYSREFEEEADGYALEYLRSRSIPSVHFANLMRRIEEKEKSAFGESESKWASYLSTHPMTEERARRFE